MADESDDGADEREVLTNLPRTRPARRSTRRTTAASEPNPKPKRPPAKPRAKPPLPPPARAAHRSPMADVAVAGIELTGALFHFGITLTRAVLGATLGRVPRP